MSLTLSRLQAALPDAAASSRRCDPAVTGLCLDSRRVQPGDLYAAVPGARSDGHAHAA